MRYILGCMRSGLSRMPDYEYRCSAFRVVRNVQCVCYRCLFPSLTFCIIPWVGGLSVPPHVLFMQDDWCITPPCAISGGDAICGLFALGNSAILGMMVVVPKSTQGVIRFFRLLRY